MTDTPKFPLKVGDSLLHRFPYMREPVPCVVKLVSAGIARIEGPEDRGLPSAWVSIHNGRPVADMDHAAMVAAHSRRVDELLEANNRYLERARTAEGMLVEANAAIADVISHEGDWRMALKAMDAAEETPEDGSGKPGYWLHQLKVLDRILAAIAPAAPGQ